MPSSWLRCRSFLWEFMVLSNFSARINAAPTCNSTARNLGSSTTANSVPANSVAANSATESSATCGVDAKEVRKKRKAASSLTTLFNSSTLAVRMQEELVLADRGEETQKKTYLREMKKMAVYLSASPESISETQVPELRCRTRPWPVRTLHRSTNRPLSDAKILAEISGGCEQIPQLSDASK